MMCGLHEMQWKYKKIACMDVLTLHERMNDMESKVWKLLNWLNFTVRIGIQVSVL